VAAVQLAQVSAYLHQYLRGRNALFSPQFSAVVADVATFAAAILRDGLEQAIDHLHGKPKGLRGRPFIEVADVIVEHHLRLTTQADRELVRKSLLEAYIHIAGPQYVFDRPGKTRLARSLRRLNVVNFAALLVSLHTFNVVSFAIQEDLRSHMPDVKSFELYMLAVEGICRNIVEDAVKTQRAGAVGEKWARAVTKAVESQLLQIPPKKTKSPAAVDFHKS
jgi:hypothetical protein